MTSATVVLAVLALGAFAGWAMSGRSVQLQTQLTALWRLPSLPYPVRIAYAVAQLWSVSLALLALATAVAPPTGQLLFVLAVGWFVVSLALAYLAPNRVFPRWLAERIAAGDLRRPLPTRWDWAILWLVVVMLIVALGAIATDVVAFGTWPFGA